MNEKNSTYKKQQLGKIHDQNFGDISNNPKL
jgi:hypothetical protein